MSDPLRIACAGASITFGLGLANRRAECYPAVLQSLLGDAFHVRNFGYCGATAGRELNEPYWQTPSFIAAERFDPQLVLLALGTNDAQHANLAGLANFERDYATLVEYYHALPKAPPVIVALPPPVFEPLEEIDVRALDQTIRPAIARIAKQLGLPVIDAYTPLVDRPDLFPDNLHPNAEGARLLAGWAAEAVVSTQ